MRERREGIECGSHIEFVALGVEQAEIDRDTPRMRRAAAGIGDEFGVGVDVPQGPLRFDWPQGVEDAQPEAERPGEFDGRRQPVGRLAMQPAFGISIDRLSR